MLILGAGDENFADQIGGGYQTASVWVDQAYGLNLIAVQVGTNPHIQAG